MEEVEMLKYIDLQKRYQILEKAFNEATDDLNCFYSFYKSVCEYAKEHLKTNKKFLGILKAVPTTLVTIPKINIKGNTNELAYQQYIKDYFIDIAESMYYSERLIEK